MSRVIKQLKFRYTNWRGDDHVYVVEPTGAGTGIDDYNRDRPVIHAEVVTRDGDPRPEMGDNRRRTFVIAEMRDIEEV
jgi:hypothetical protein